MSDKLAVIQFDESKKELQAIHKLILDFSGDYDKLLAKTEKPLSLFSTGNYKDTIAAQKELIQIEKDLGKARRRNSVADLNIEKQKLLQIKQLQEETIQRSLNAKAKADEARSSVAINAAYERQQKKIAEINSAYSRLSKETLQAKKEAKDLAAQMYYLEAAFKRGDISTGQYKNQLAKLSKEYVTAEAKARGYDTAIKKIDKSVGDNQRNVGNYGKSLSGIYTAFNSIAGAFGVSVGLNLVAEGFTKMISKSKELEQLNNSLLTVFETQDKVVEQQAYLSSVSDRYGLDLINLTQQYKSFAASAKGTNLEGEKSQRIFDVTAEASAKLGLTTEQTEGALMALSQMISKGTVQSEELRGQLGERIPGAFNIFAKGLNVTTAELGGMLKRGEVLSEDALPKFADALENAFGLDKSDSIDSLTASTNRLQTEFDKLLVLLSSGTIGDGFKSFIDGLKEALEFVNGFKTDASVLKIDADVSEINTWLIQAEKARYNQEEWGKLVDDINAKYPLLLENIKEEGLSYDNVSKALEKRKELSLEDRIIAETQAEINAVNKDTEERITEVSKAISKNAEAYLSLNDIQKEVVKEIGNGNISYDEAINKLDELGAETNIYTSKGDALSKLLGDISIASNFWNVTNGKLTKGLVGNKQEVSALEKKMRDLKKAQFDSLSPMERSIYLADQLASAYRGTAYEAEALAIAQRQIGAYKSGNKSAIISAGLEEVILGAKSFSDGIGKNINNGKGSSSGSGDEGSSGKPKKNKPRQSTPRASRGSSSARSGSTKSAVDVIKEEGALALAELELQRKKELAIERQAGAESIGTIINFEIEKERIRNLYLKKELDAIKGNSVKQKTERAKLQAEIIENEQDLNKNVFDIKKKEIDRLKESDVKKAKSDFSGVEQTGNEDEIIQARTNLTNRLLAIQMQYSADLVQIATDNNQDLIKIETDLYDELESLNQNASELNKKSQDEIVEGISKRNDEIIEEQKKADTILENAEKIKEENRNKRIGAMKEAFDGIVQGTDFSFLSDNLSQIFDVMLMSTKEFTEKFGNDTSKWAVVSAEAFAIIGEYASNYFEESKNQEIESLERKNEENRKFNEERIKEIEAKMGYLTSVMEQEDLNAEQKRAYEEEYKALEDEKAVFNEQTANNERLLAIRKARAEQKANAQKALINGAVGATQTIAQLGWVLGAVPAAISLGFGMLQAAFIMAKNPIPQYYKGVKGANEGYAWTQERGAEIITDKSGNIKTLGQSKGAELTFLQKGDNVYTASQSKKMLSDIFNSDNGEISGYTKNIKIQYDRDMVSNYQRSRERINYDTMYKMQKKAYKEAIKETAQPYTYEENGRIFRKKGNEMPIFVGYAKKDNKIVVNLKNKDRI